LGLLLAMGLGLRAVLGAQLIDGVDDVVTHEQHGADAGQGGALGDGLDGQLGLARVLRRGALSRRGARLRGRRTLRSGSVATRARLAGVRGALGLGLGGAGGLGHLVGPSLWGRTKNLRSNLGSTTRLPPNLRS